MCPDGLTTIRVPSDRRLCRAAGGNVEGLRRPPSDGAAVHSRLARVYHRIIIDQSRVHVFDARCHLVA